MENPTDWSNITAENTDTLSEIVESVLESTPSKDKIARKKRGRPPKISAATPETATPTLSGSSTPSAPPPMRPEEMLSNADLVNMFSCKQEPASKSPRGILRFSADNMPTSDGEQNEEELTETLDTEVLLKVYESFFQEPLASRHNIKKKNFADKPNKKSLESELKKLQRAVGSSDPASDLGKMWAGAMGVAEGIAVSMNYPLMGLGDVATARSQTPQMLDTFRELLIKYPSMRKWLVLGGFPELRLAIASGNIAREVFEHNVQQMLNASEILSKNNK